MKSKILILSLLLGVVMHGFSMAEVVGISQQSWDSSTNDYWFNQKCDEVRQQEVYLNQYGVYLDNFVNPASNPGALYLHKNKVLTRGNYLLYNPSNHVKGNGLSIFNRDLLGVRWWKVNPGEKVRHMTTAEEVSGASFSYDWKLDVPYTAFDGKKFYKPNFRSDGTHPQTPTKFPSRDAEFRTITLYDNDDKLSTSSNNRAIVECQQHVIRWCGDGILDKKYGEKCDPKDPQKAGWGNKGCNASCQPINEEVKKIYDLALTKTIQNQKDSYTKGENITFAITVHNQGELVARNIEVTDYLPAGLELKDANWTQENGMIKTTIAGPINPGQSKTVTLTTRIKPDFRGSDILNLAEISKDNSGEYGTTDKDSTPDKNQNNDCFVEGKHLTSGNAKSGSNACNDGTDEDDHDGVRFSVRDPKKPIYDLALTKQIKAPVKHAYALGDELTFVITVHNQGELIARNIEVTDYLPEGLILKDTRWTFDPQTRKATYQIPGELAVNGTNSSRSIEMNVVIDGNFKGSKILNRAEITRDNASDYGTVDKDSTPDQNADNDCFSEKFLHRTSGNGKTGGVCTEATDEDDHDGDIITIAKPTIKKDLQEVGKVYQEGDLVGFKMPFANNTNDTVNNVSIKDFMPLNLEYVSSEIHGVIPAYHQTYQIGGVTVDEWSGFNLLPSQNGVLYLTGRVLKTNLDSRLNTVGIYTNNILVEKDSEHYELGNRKVIIEKDVNKNLVASGEIAQYTIKVTATEGAYDELLVVDTLPKGVVYQEGSYKLGASNTLVNIESATLGVNAQGLQTITWRLRFPQKLAKNQTFSLVYDAKLTVGEKKIYKNVACVEDPKKPNDTPICDPADITPPDPNPPRPPRPTDPTVQIKKYVNKVGAESGREDVLMTGFAQGQTGYFTLEAQNASAGMNTFTITDTIEGNLSYVDSSDLLNNAFTGVFLRGNGNSSAYKYTTNQTVEKLSNNTTRLTWKVVMTEGQFLPGDKYQVQFKVKVNGDQRNVAFIEYPGGKWNDDASVKTEDVKLAIKKYVSDKIDGTYNDDSITLSNNTTAFFKLVVSGATNSLTWFVVKDTIKDNLKFDFSSTGLANNAFTGVIAFGTQNPNKPAYKITPTISGTYPADIEWKVEILNGNFMPGDSLTIIFKATKLGTQENVATVEYPKRDGTTGKSSDPAKVRSHSTPSVTPPSTPSNGWWGWGGYYSPSCGNGYKNGYEICDREGEYKIPSDGKLFKNENIYDTKYAGYTCTASCGLKNNGEQVAPKCFNLQNGSISIMKWEVLPFYWNLDGMAGKATPKEKQDWLKDHYVENKDKAGLTPKIDISSMKCTFKVYGPGMKEVYNFTAPCFNPDGWQDALKGTYSSIKDYINQNRAGWLGGSLLLKQGRVKNVFDTLDNQGQYPVLFPLSSKLLITDFGQSSASLVKSNSDVPRLSLSNIQTFGEYKVALEQIDYSLVSKDEKGKITEEKKVFNDRICEVDFAVTDHYMIQRSPYGIGNKATKDLKAYKLMKWDSFISDGKLFGTERAVEQAYAPSKELQKQFITFKNKYAKLAKPLKDGLSKVPGKAIYLVSGKEINLKKLISDSSKPFTLIATDSSANITIKGDLNTNAMIMTQGTITFDASNSCNGGDRKSGHAGQIVKGIFYAGAGFKSSNHDNLKNTYDKLSDGDRCNYGNLHIKGVAIGDLSKVVAARRSELYTWFQGNGGGKDGGEKVQKIINGASVLVDYNPTLRGNLPPGANEFNKALAVYRK